MEKESVIRDLNLLWIRRDDEYLCYDFDDNKTRILVGVYDYKDTVSKSASKPLSKSISKSVSSNGSYPKSKFIGVNLHTQAYRAGRKNKWQASFIHKGKKHHLGTFETDYRAAVAYDNGVKNMNLDNVKELNFG